MLTDAIMTIVLMAQLHVPPNYIWHISKQWSCLDNKAKHSHFKLKGKVKRPTPNITCVQSRNVQAYLNYLEDKGIPNEIEDIFGRY